MAEGEITPDEHTLLEHLKSVRFQAGVEEGRWEVLELAFPVLIVRVNGEDLSGQTRTSMDFRMECDGFPAIAPFVERWDYQLGGRPTQPAVPPAPPTAAPSVTDALKDWSNPQGAHGGIYQPWQRYAADHNGWAAIRPDLAWHRNRNISFIMEELYALISEQAAWLASRPAA